MSSPSSTADAILASARDLVVAGGYNGFSYADIAAVVGIRKASIHHHFPAKADLVEALVARYRAETRAALESLESQIAGPAELLGSYVSYWQACIARSDPPFCVCAQLASELPRLPEGVAREVRAHFRGLADWLSAVIARGGREGVLDAADPVAEGEIVMATVHGAMLSARAYGTPEVFGVITAPLLDRLSRRD
ncbi:TetR/AcrR family transcriptional regulator [Mangrovibrevibacter kandeliae]|uniref:TetR/AcrR family transcriptional regulator n=1 Tax=Mangrovibrevibacter kandeliae TaxID=2968473 RepID=UPI00211852C3|nr:TetR/AcrR family transcriptional regulator [Aurantimonas sp. CSK15Z-1]